ncbi:diguanylate cyclase (GGDEF)-like protein [Nakamurella sp. UYEF19]|uniref:sensor domain-containing diguanylate cyclase n=1 Tax=Nakamurella sp. UYEF19 TaxID=1756392 RepID=UPI00339A5F52
MTGRIDAVVELLTRLAAGELDARGIPSKTDDEIDAVIVGVNMLAEELQASHDELEGRVHARTLELQELNHDITRLTKLGNVLQACDNVDEAFAALGESLGELFQGMSGSLHLFRSSRNVLELKVSWGQGKDDRPLAPSDCWGLRRGQQHLAEGDHPALLCQHVRRRTGTSICIPMSAHGEISGLLQVMDRTCEPGSPLPPVPLTPAKQSLALAVSEQAALALANLELRDKLRLQALRDPLTGLLNRRFVEEWLDREVARTDQSGRSFGVIMADIDHFKQINDLHGHDAGDQILKAVGDAIRSSLRPSDLPCRYGGEEFLLMLADVDGSILAARAEQVRSRVAALRIDHRGSPLPGVTLSAGIALYPQHGTDGTAVIDAADVALYVAKNNGRNQICVATGSADR